MTIEVVERGEARLRCGSLSFVVANTSGISTGPGHVALRYERVRFGAAAAGVPIRHEAEVRDVIFAGSVVQYVVSLREGPLELIAEQPHAGGDALLARGERVAVGWDPAAPRLFAGE